MGLLSWVVTAGLLRAVVLQPEQCGDVTFEETQAAATLAVNWLQNNQNPNGSWLYRYDRAEQEDLGGYNNVRHVGAIEALEKAASAGIDGASETSLGGIRWAERRLVDVENGIAFADSSTRASAGGAALLVAGLAERRDRTGDPEFDELMIELGNFMVGTVQPNGSVLGQYDLVADEVVPQSWSKFYTGEVFWALARLHMLFPAEGFDEPTLRIAAYLPQRDDVEDWWPTIPDHWSAYGFATMANWPDPPDLNDAQVGWISEQIELQSLQIRYESQRTDSWWTYVTRGRPTLGAGLGTLGEALNQWWIVAGTDDRLAEFRPTIAERGRCVAGVLVERQADDGAWYQFDVTQIDDQQHTLSALIFSQPLIAAGE